jgi:ABC-type transport system involved in multi-copper enzyme maturation permease subunit
MTATFAAESLKLRKRPATWVLGALLAATVVLFGYVLAYVVTRALPADAAGAQQLDSLQRALRPENFPSVVLSVLAGFGGPIALILGAMAAGSEYGWNTLKTILTQRPSRLSVLAGKLLGLGAVLAAFAASSFAAALAASLVLAPIMDAPIAFPSLLEIARDLLAAWLILAAWAAIGLALGTVLRGTSLAIGLGLTYGLVVEGSIGIFARQVELLATLHKLLPGTNSAALARSLASSVLEQPPAPVGAARAVFTLACYIVGCSAIAALVLRRRDVA